MSGKPSLRRAFEAEVASASRLAGRDVAEDEPAALLPCWVSAEFPEKVGGWISAAIHATRLPEPEPADFLFAQLPRGTA